MPSPVIPYDTAQTALNTAIVIANDAGSSAGLAGNVLNPNTNPGVFPAMQERYRYLQQRLISAGVDNMTKTEVIFALPPSQASDPRVNSILTYNGFFDGLVWHGPNVSAPAWSSSTTYTQQMVVTYGNGYYVALPNSGTNLNKEPDQQNGFWQLFNNFGPTLPPDLAKPLEIWECQTGGNYWVPMVQAVDSITTRPIQPRVGEWLFSYDRLVLRPASSTNDLKIKYLQMYPDLVTLQSQLMIRNCTTALAYLVVEQISAGRGGSQTQLFGAKAEEAISQLINQTVRKMAYGNYEHKPFRGGRGGRGRGR